MPQIRQFEAPEGLGFRPTETGINATAQAARRVGAEYGEAAAATEKVGHAFASDIQMAGEVAIKYADHQQISAGANTLANTVNAKTKEWDDIAKNADPNDPTVADRFLKENLEPELEKFKSGFWTENGQKWAQAHADQFRSHMFNKTSADMATMAGQAAIINNRQTVNGLSNTVRGDPSSMDFALKTLESSTNAVLATSPNLTGVAASKVKTDLLQKGKEEIIKSAALGHIEKTGEVPAWASDPKYSPYINGAELKQFQSAAKYYKRLSDSEERSARVMQEHQAKIDFNTKVNELEASILPKEVGERPTLPRDAWDKVRELSRHPGAALDPGRVKALVSQFDAITNRTNKPEPMSAVSNRTELGLIRRFRATDDSRLEPGDEATKAVYEEYDKGNLSSAGFRRMLNEANLRTPAEVAIARDRKEFFKQHSVVIDPTLGATAEGAQKLYFAEMDARRQEDVLRKQGKDPHLVYDPRAPEFFGDPKNMSRFKASLTDLMNGLRQGEQGVVPKVGERKQFKQGWGVWDGKAYVPESAPQRAEPSGSEGNWPIGQVDESTFHSMGLGMRGADIVTAVKGILKGAKLNSAAWDAWLKDAPESENIEDRRGDSK